MLGEQEHHISYAIKDSTCSDMPVSVWALSWNGRQLTKVRPGQWQEMYEEPERNCDLSINWKLMWVLHTTQQHAEFVFLRFWENDLPHILLTRSQHVSKSIFDRPENGIWLFSRQCIVGGYLHSAAYDDCKILFQKVWSPNTLHHSGLSLLF